MLQDIRFTLRTLRKNPGFACAAVLTLALGIGANAAIYSVIDNVLLHPIPFSEPDRLVALYQKNPRSDKNSIPYLNLQEWQKQSRTFEGIAGWRTDGFALTGQGAPENLLGLDVSENFFSVLPSVGFSSRGRSTNSKNTMSAPSPLRLPNLSTRV